MLYIKNLYVNLKNKCIINGLNLRIKPGEIHAIMGPNGSGKSTLVLSLARNKYYKINSGEILFNGIDITNYSPDKIAGEGLFVSFQNPVEITGVNNYLFLYTAVNSIRKYRNKKIFNKEKFNEFITKKINLLKISEKLLHRSVNVGFSGGEKKINDILQMIALEPNLCILDEIDSGLDIDALKLVANCINNFFNKSKSLIIVTHYKKILDYIKPDYVHILYKGNIIRSDDFSLAKKIENLGYEWAIK